ncbi:hypothetical protein DET49_101127 [Salegentibacter sp. 24]|uniref:DUF2007 domain-containing protein n=1 Tax=Salegentibacter sp. 24 TaxID=2183986 RepID=UPI001061B236|nr:DUF2007 domain-containing protein [Salegentibacter sp. 24]TDN95529.1 hypothetical protein DET49_101127 [Salegentibacter sp. 24]
MKETFVNIACYQYSSEAQIVKGKLQSEGIEVFLADQVLIDTDPLISQAIGGVKMNVRTCDRARALAVLNEIENYSLDNEGKRLICPSCNSIHVKVYTNVKDLRSFLAFLISFLTFSLPIHYKYDYYCESCKNKFS